MWRWYPESSDTNSFSYKQISLLDLFINWFLVPPSPTPIGRLGVFFHLTESETTGIYCKLSFESASVLFFLFFFFFFGRE